MVAGKHGKDAIKTRQFIEQQAKSDETGSRGEGHGVEEFLVWVSHLNGLDLRVDVPVALEGAKGARGDPLL